MKIYIANNISFIDNCIRVDEIFDNYKHRLCEWAAETSEIGFLKINEHNVHYVRKSEYLNKELYSDYQVVKVTTIISTVLNNVDKVQISVIFDTKI